MSAFDWDDASEFFTDDWTEQVTYNLSSYDGIRYTKTLSSNTEQAGLSNDIQFSMMFLTSDFSSLPVTGDLMTIDSTEMRITDVRLDSTKKTFTCDFVEKYG